MSAAQKPQKAADDFALGESVLISGIVIGTSEFSDGPAGYKVEFLRGGKRQREWFIAEDFVAPASAEAGK